MDKGNKFTLIIELEALPLQGPTKTKGKLVQETRLRESLKNGNKGRSNIKHKKVRYSYQNKHSRSTSIVSL